MPMYTTKPWDELTQGAKGTNSKDNKDGTDHKTAYSNTNRVSADIDKEGNMKNLHTTNNNSNTHYNIEYRKK